MQKLLSTVASLGAVVLFISIAASWEATLFLLAAYGALFLYVGVPLGYGLIVRREWMRRSRHRSIPRLIQALPWIFLSLMSLAAIYSFLFSSEAGREWSNQELTSFGLWQIIGLVGMSTTAFLALVVALDLRRHLYRECPHCLSPIRREATRCRYCTSEVERATERRRHPTRETAGPARRRQAVGSERRRLRRFG